MSVSRLPPRDLALVTLVAAVWGFNFISGARGTQHFSPYLFMVIRMCIVLLVTLPFLRPPPRDQWPRLVAVALLLGVAHFLALFGALSRSADVFSIVVVQQTYIPMTVLLAMALLRERPGPRTLAAVAVAFLGVVLIGLDPLILSQLDILALTLAAALFAALGSLFQRHMHGIGVLNYQAWTAVIALPPLLLISLLVEDNQWQVIRSAGTGDWASVLYTALIASVVGHGLFYFLVQRHPVSAVMPYLQMMPVFGAVFGVTIWGDRPGWRLLVGSAVVIVGILIVTLRGRRRALPPR